MDAVVLAWALVLAVALFGGLVLVFFTGRRDR